MRRAPVVLTVVGLMVLTGALLAAVSGRAGVAHAAISSLKPASGETTPGGTVWATVTVDSGILTTCLTATSDNPVKITVTFDGLALSCGTGTWSSDMKVSVSTLIEPGLYNVHVQEVDLLGSVLKSHPWPLTVTAPTTTTTTSPTTSTTTTTPSTTTTTTTLIKLPPTTLPKLLTTTTASTTTTTIRSNTTSSTTTTTTPSDERDTTTTQPSTTTTIAAGAGPGGGGPTDTGGEDGEGTGDGGGSGDGSEDGATSQRTSGLLQPPIGLGADIPTGLFGSTAPEVLGFDITPGFSDAVELIEASWIWVLALALLIAGALVKGIDRRVSPIPARPNPAE